MKNRTATTAVAGVAAVLAVSASAVAISGADGDSTATESQVADTRAEDDHGDAVHSHEDGVDHVHGAIESEAGDVYRAPFDLVRTVVRREGENLVFVERVRGRAGSVKPARVGEFAGSKVLSYVWPTTIDPARVGFRRESGILALAATSHPDFDDTPLYDETRDGAKDNDGGLWHAHWVVLVPDPTRADGALKVRDIAEGATPRLPRTWPGAPIYLDSPKYSTRLQRHSVRISLPLSAVGGDTSFEYDGVTAALKVNADLHDPLLRVSNVIDVASGDLSLPGTVVDE